MFDLIQTFQASFPYSFKYHQKEHFEAWLIASGTTSVSTYV